MRRVSPTKLTSRGRLNSFNGPESQNNSGRIKLHNKSISVPHRHSNNLCLLFSIKVSKTVDSCMKVSFTRAFDVGLVQPVPIVVKDFLEPSKFPEIFEAFKAVCPINHWL